MNPKLLTEQLLNPDLALIGRGSIREEGFHPSSPGSPILTNVCCIPTFVGIEKQRSGLSSAPQKHVIRRYFI